MQPTSIMFCVKQVVVSYEDFNSQYRIIAFKIDDTLLMYFKYNNKQ